MRRTISPNRNIGKAKAVAKMTENMKSPPGLSRCRDDQPVNARSGRFRSVGELVQAWRQAHNLADDHDLTDNPPHRDRTRSVRIWIAGKEQVVNQPDIRKLLDAANTSLRQIAIQNGQSYSWVHRVAAGKANSETVRRMIAKAVRRKPEERPRRAIAPATKPMIAE